MKLILAAGGKGTRVKEITGGVIPKGLVRLIDKPLISYQLQLIKKAGIKEVYVSMNEDWQIQLFKESVRINEFPKLDYYFDTHRWGHPLNAFTKDDLFKFINGEDFFWTYGDLIYDEHLLERLYEVANRNKTSVGCKVFTGTRKPLDGKYISFNQDSSGKIIGYKHEDKYELTIDTPFYFKNSVLEDIQKELMMNEPRQVRLLMRIVDNEGLSIVEPELFINMNLPEDLEMIKNFLRSQT